MKTYNKNPEAVSLLTPEQYRVTQQDGTERPFQNAILGQQRARTLCRCGVGRAAIRVRR